MAEIESESVYTVTDRADDVWCNFLMAGQHVIPSGPYFDVHDTDEMAQSMCDMEYLEAIMAATHAEYGQGQELTGFAKNILRYICAALLKHAGFAAACDYFERHPYVAAIYGSLHNQGLELIKELYATQAFSPNHKRWLALEQKQSIQVVDHYPVVLEWACQANEDLVERISVAVKYAGDRGFLRCDDVVALEDELVEEFIDLSALGRRQAVILNTIRLRFVRKEEQLELFSRVHRILEHAMEELMRDSAGGRRGRGAGGR
ncbi:hypothetical protein MMC13_000890 [Lambiella insularis]|nr:hypothetical protein [Lambiella insularis]